MIIKFYYNKVKDLNNYTNNYIDTSFPEYGRDISLMKKNMVSFLRPSFVGKISDETIPKEKRIKDINDYLDHFEVENKSFFCENLESIENLWAEREEKYLSKLVNYFGKELPFKEISAYFTTLTICPYNKNEDYFYLTVWSNIASQITSICHETMHLYFLHNFEEYCFKNSLIESDILNLNEALTVMLNFQFSNILITHEKNNKPSTKSLQSHIAGLCREKKDFKYILDSSMNFIKEET